MNEQLFKNSICLKTTLFSFIFIFFSSQQILANNLTLDVIDRVITLKSHQHLGLTVQSQKISNNTPIILHQGLNHWKMLSNGAIVLKDNPKFGLTVQSQSVKNGTSIILHEGYSLWKVLSNGAIVLKDNPRFGLTVEGQASKNNTKIILHEGYNTWTKEVKAAPSNDVNVTVAVPFYVKISDASLYLHAHGGSKMGAKETLHACPKGSNFPNCQWIFEKSATNPDAYYIKSKGGYYLHAHGGASPGAEMTLHSCPKNSDFKNCQWVLERSPKNKDLVYVKSLGTNLYLHAHGGASLGAKMTLHACPKDKNFPHCQWELENSPPAKVNKTVAVNFAEKKQNGKLLGHFAQIAPTTWLEKSSLNNDTRKWVELYRDEWSVYLKDRTANIQIDLFTKEIYYWENHKSNNRIKLYDIGTSSNKSNGYMVTLVEHSEFGSNQKFGEFSRVGYELWKEIGVNGAINLFKETQRDERSVYLHDESRNVFIQLDLNRKKVRHKESNGTYSDLYDITSSYGMNNPAKDGIINFPGSNQSVTVDGLKNILKKEGLRLVATNELKEGECAIIFPKYNTKDVSTEFGCLVCNERINNELTMKYQAVHGKCQAFTQGAGVECGVVVGEAEVVFDKGNGEKKTYILSGPSASACGSLSANRMCASAGTELAGVQFTDQNGNGVGVSLDAGVGVGLAQDYSDGVLSLSFDLKIGLGGSLSLSVNLEELKDNPESGFWVLAETGYLIGGGAVRVASEPLKSFLSSALGEDVAEIPNTAISATVDCPFDVVKWIFTQDDIDCLD